MNHTLMFLYTKNYLYFNFNDIFKLYYKVIYLSITKYFESLNKYRATLIFLSYFHYYYYDYYTLYFVFDNINTYG